MARVLQHYHEGGGQVAPYTQLSANCTEFDFRHHEQDCRDGWRNPIRLVRLPDGRLAVMSSGPNGQWESGGGDDLSEALPFLPDD